MDFNRLYNSQVQNHGLSFNRSLRFPLMRTKTRLIHITLHPLSPPNPKSYHSLHIVKESLIHMIICLFISIWHTTLKIPALIIEFFTSFSTNTPSRIDLPLRKGPCSFEMIKGMTSFTLDNKILAMILYILPTKLIGLKP